MTPRTKTYLVRKLQVWCDRLPQRENVVSALDKDRHNALVMAALVRLDVWKRLSASQVVKLRPNRTSLDADMAPTVIKRYYDHSEARDTKRYSQSKSTLEKICLFTVLFADKRKATNAQTLSPRHG